MTAATIPRHVALPAPMDSFAERLSEVAAVRHIADRPVAEIGRQAALYEVEIDDSRLLVEHSPAPHGPHRETLVFFPGLTEHIRQPHNRSFHDRLSGQFPAADVMTIGSNGIGVTGHDTANRTQRNAQRLKLLQATVEGTVITSVGTSMGSQVSSDVALLNFRSGSPLKIGGQVYFSSALVAGCRTPQAMVRDFVPRLTYDMARNFGRQPVSRWPGMVGSLATWGARAIIETPSEINHLRHLMIGTEIEQLDTIADNGTRLLIINGLKDSVCEEKALRGLASRHDNVRFVGIPDHGHELAFDPMKPALKVGREMQAFGMLTTST